jgi:hypothetical protein
MTESPWQRVHVAAVGAVCVSAGFDAARPAAAARLADLLADCAWRVCVCRARGRARTDLVGRDQTRTGSASRRSGTRHSRAGWSCH